MPLKPTRLCSHPTCSTRVASGYCDAHPPKDRDRPEWRRFRLGTLYGRRWRKARAEFLRRNPLCLECYKRGRVEAATVVDHHVPHRGDARLFWDVSNWRPLCERHHNQKTSGETIHRPRGTDITATSKAETAGTDSIRVSSGRVSWD